MFSPITVRRSPWCAESDSRRKDFRRAIFASYLCINGEWRDHERRALLPDMPMPAETLTLNTCRQVPIQWPQFANWGYSTQARAPTFWNRRRNANGVDPTICRNRLAKLFGSSNSVRCPILAAEEILKS